MIELTQKADDGSSALIEHTLLDFDGTKVTPKTVNWSLYNNDGNIVNGRDAVSATPGTPTKVILKKDDLLISGLSNGRRYIQFWGKYDSTEGNDLDFSEEASFVVEGQHDHS